MPGTGFLTNNVASACNERVHSKWARLLMTEAFAFLYGTSFGPCENKFFLNVNYFSDTLELLLLFPFPLGHIWFMAILYKFKISLQEVVWGATSNMWLASTRCWVKLQAEKQERSFVYISRHAGTGNQNQQCLFQCYTFFPIPFHFVVI